MAETLQRSIAVQIIVARTSLSVFHVAVLAKCAMLHLRCGGCLRRYKSMDINEISARSRAAAQELYARMAAATEAQVLDVSIAVAAKGCNVGHL